MNPWRRAERAFLMGVSSAIKQHKNWRIRLEPDASKLTTEAFLRKTDDEPLDAAIICETNVPDLPDILRRSPIPIIVFGPTRTGKWPRSVVFVTSDDIAIGHETARHILHLGAFRTYGFVHVHPRAQWSTDRLTGFSQIMSQAKKDVSVCDETDASRLSGWLRAAPKPMAVFAAEDITALNVLTICQTLNLRIPEQVAVLGTSDDELVCSLSVPALSSIAANHGKEGALAVRELERLLRRKRRDPVGSTTCLIWPRSSGNASA